jgi:hypothetical protein
MAAAVSLMLAGTLAAAGLPPAGHRSGASISGQLEGVAALSASDAWAVGSTASASLILRWNGTAWSQVPSPAVPFSILTGVSMVSASDGWAVGYYDSSTGPQKTLILHWNGTSWAKVTSPDPSPGGDLLFGVSGVSATDAWAVGWYYTTPSNLTKTMVLHWDGTRWAEVASPNPSSQANSLAGVSASSASDAWAVGNTGLGTLTMHWNGTSWEHVKAPSPGAGLGGSQLSAVSDAAAANAWAVGEYGAPGNREKTLTLHWDGTRWAQVASPSPGTGQVHDIPLPNELAAVSTMSPSDAWAAGDYHTGTEQAPLTLRWNGARWAQVASPGASAFTVLTGLSMVSATDGWAVGSDNSTGTVLILHWNGATWSQS